MDSCSVGWGIWPSLRPCPNSFPCTFKEFHLETVITQGQGSNRWGTISLDISFGATSVEKFSQLYYR